MRAINAAQYEQFADLGGALLEAIARDVTEAGARAVVHVLASRLGRKWVHDELDAWDAARASADAAAATKFGPETPR